MLPRPWRSCPRRSGQFSFLTTLQTEVNIMRKQKRSQEKIRIIIGLLASAVFLFSGYKVCNYFYEARQSSTVTDELIAKAVEIVQDVQLENHTEVDRRLLEHGWNAVFGLPMKGRLFGQSLHCLRAQYEE